MTSLYTVTAVVAALASVVIDVAVVRARVVCTLRYWITMVIVLGFQVAVDGRLTRLPHPVVRYDDADMTGWRFPLDIPVEDFAFAVALITLTLTLWARNTAHLDRTPGHTNSTSDTSEGP